MLVYLLRLISSVATDKKKHFEHVHSNTHPPPSLLSLWTTRNHIVQAIAIIPFVDKLCHNIKIENPVANLFHWPNIPQISAFPRANIDVTAELAVNYRTLFAAKQKKLHPGADILLLLLSFCGGLVCISVKLPAGAKKKSSLQNRDDASQGSNRTQGFGLGVENCRDKMLKFMDHWKLWWIEGRGNSDSTLFMRKCVIKWSI